MSLQSRGSASAKENSGSRSKSGKNRASAAARSRKRKVRSGKSKATRAIEAGSAVESAQEKPAQPREWTRPVPLATRSLPGLDCAKLPPVLGDFCAGLARELLVPVELVLTYALAVVATCAQRTYSVKLYGTNTQPINLFLMCPMSSASRKQAALKACTSPLTHWEKEQARELGPQISSESIQRMITRRAIRKLANRAVDAQIANDTATLENLVTQIVGLESSISNPTVLPHLVTDTLTGLEEATHQQYDTLSLARADDNCLDVLSAASSRSARDLVLKSWDASHYMVDKRNAHYCARPRISMALAPRADILADPAKARLL